MDNPEKLVTFGRQDTRQDKQNTVSFFSLFSFFVLFPLLPVYLDGPFLIAYIWFFFSRLLYKTSLSIYRYIFPSIYTVHAKCSLTFLDIYACLMVFNATFNNISVISWRSVLLVEETVELGENHRHVLDIY